MEKKYYLRGLGLGIIVTAVIMGIALSSGKKREMTDAEIIARAKELGMTENTTLLAPAEETEKPQETEPAEEKETVKEPVEEPVKKDVAVAQPQQVSEKNTETVEPPKEDTNEMTKPDDDAEQATPPASTSVSSEQSQAEKPSAADLMGNITVVSGDGSYTVARKLEEAGYVSSAGDFDDFLCQNGYDKKLRTGTFQIPKDASYEQIARIMTSQPR